MAKKPTSQSGDPKPAPRRPMDVSGVISKPVTGFTSKWREAFEDPPREPRVENFDVYLKYERWEGYETICLVIDVDPKSIDPGWGPRNRELATAYRTVVEFLERVDKSGLKSNSPTDTIEWINGLRDVLPVPLPAYWPAAQGSPKESVSASLDADKPVPNHSGSSLPSDARTASSSLPAGLSTGDLCAAFNLGSAWKSRLTHHKKHSYVQSALRSDEGAGQRGKKNRWNPVAFALLLLEKEEKTRSQVDTAFRKRPELAEWRPEWQQYIDSQTDD